MYQHGRCLANVLQSNQPFVIRALFLTCSGSCIHFALRGMQANTWDRRSQNAPKLSKGCLFSIYKLAENPRVLGKDDGVFSMYSCYGLLCNLRFLG